MFEENYQIMLSIILSIIKCLNYQFMLSIKCLNSKIGGGERNENLICFDLSSMAALCGFGLAGWYGGVVFCA